MIIKSEILYHPTPKELAEEFCMLYESAQAKFFNEIGEIFANEPHQLCIQLQYLSDSPILNDKGRYAMKKIGEYAEKMKQDE